MSNTRPWHLLLAPCTLFGFALAQPLFDLLGRQPMFLLEHEVGPPELAVLLFSTWIGPGCAVGALALGLWRLRAVAGRIWLALWIALLVTATLLPLCAQATSQQPTASFAVAGALGLFGAAWSLRSPHLLRGLAWAALAPLTFSLVFVLRPSTRGAVFPSAGTTVAAVNSTGTLRPIVLLVLDEIPTTSLLRGPNEIDAARYPNFAALQRDSIWYRHAYTVSGATHRALAAILTGNYVRDDTAPTVANFPQNLFTLLQQDFEPFVCETTARLAPAAMGTTLPSLLRQRLALLGWDCGVLWLHRVLPQPLRRSLPPADDRWVGFGRKIPHRPGHAGRLLDWVDNLERSAKPMLAFAHVQFPHNPYNYYPNGKKHSHRNAEPHKLGGPWIDEAWPVQQSWQRSLLQLQYADALLGRLLDRLRELELYDETIVAITADHGASYRPGDYHRRLSQTNFMDILPVPLLLKLPDSERGGEIDERLVASIDLLPTLAQASGFAVNWSCDGVSMLDSTTSARNEAVFYDPIGDDVERRFSLAQLQASEATRLRKLELFDTAAGEWRDYAFGPYAGLLGAPLDAFTPGEASHLTAYLRQAAALADVDLDAEMVPGELRGELESSRAPDRPYALAVAMRDSIVAVTQSVVENPRSASQDWLALVPFSRLRPGANAVELFEIASSSPPMLHPIELSNGSPSFLGRQLATITHERIPTEGFYPPFSRQATVRRWTNGAARLTVPIRAGDEAAILRIDIERSSPQGSELTIRCGERVLFADRIPAGPWRRDFALPRSVQSERTSIELASTSFVPAELDSTETDQRRLGILLNGLWLLGDTSPAEASQPARR